MSFRFRQPKSASSAAAQPEGREAGSIGAAAVALVALFLVLLSVFIYLSRLNRGPGQPADAGAPVATAIAPLPTTVAAPPGLAPSTADDGILGILGVLNAAAADNYQTLRDEDWAYELMLPAAWPVASLGDDGPGLLTQAQHDRVVEAPSGGARLALSVWQVEDPSRSLQAWAERLVPGLAPVDGSWEPNATVAGQPALCLWSAESATQPLRLATLLQHGGRLYLLSYSAPDGGAALGHYLKALVSLRFLDAAAASAESADQVPPLPLPAPRYYPSERLFR